MFTYRGGGGQGHPMQPGDGGVQERGGVVDGSVYGLYGVPPQQHAQSRLSPGTYGNAQQFTNARGPNPQVYEFEYEEPRFT